MDCWHLVKVRAERQDAVWRWAQLEGKSPVMCEELAGRYVSRSFARGQSFSGAAIFVEVLAIVLKAWWQFYGG